MASEPIGVSPAAAVARAEKLRPCELDPKRVDARRRLWPPEDGVVPCAAGDFVVTAGFAMTPPRKGSPVVQVTGRFGSLTSEWHAW